MKGDFSAVHWSVVVIVIMHLNFALPQVDAVVHATVFHVLSFWIGLSGPGRFIAVHH